MKPEITLLFLCLFLCPHWGSAQPSDAETIIRQNSAEFSANLVNRQYEALVQAYTADASIFPQGLEILTGHDAIRKYWTPPAGRTATAIRHQIFPTKIEVMGKTALDWGYYEGTTLRENGETIDWRGKYVIIWKEVTPGVWKMQLDAWSASPIVQPFPVTDSTQLIQSPILNTPAPEFAAALSADGHTFWFNRMSEDRAKMYLLSTNFTDGHWSSPTVPAFVDSAYWHIDPWVMPHQKGLLLSTKRPLTQQADREDYNLWQLHPNGVFSPLPETINSADDEIYCSQSKNGNLYFARFINDKAKIFVSKWEDKQFQPAEILHIPGTDSAAISNPAISPNDQFLVFVSGNLGGMGSADLFLSRKQADGSWSIPENLGSGINSNYIEFAPGFSADGKTLFFTSERPGIVSEAFPAGQRRPGDLYAVAFDPIAKDKAAIRQINQQYVQAWLEGNKEGILSLFEADARITPNGNKAIEGLDALREFWFPKDGSLTTIHQFESEVLSVDIQGNTAASFQKTKLEWSYEKGDAKMGKIQYGYAHGTYQRQPDGSWKMNSLSWTDYLVKDR
ncbi:MAG TPA: DUF4440 domain-containing protein [Saprospiraceae bacterium]|nr:DUF4440 domain-containing protein [Saprospiraceae bacterium]HMQ83527.1 DUF4440 domain-containing protein [Saprospiraceae bacterium]